MFLEPRMGGLDTYVRALVPEMARLAPDVRFTIYCSPGGREYLRAEQGFGEFELGRERISFVAPPENVPIAWKAIDRFLVTATQGIRKAS